MPKRENKNKTRSHTRTRVGSTPMRVQTLVNRGSGRKPSDMERDKSLSKVVMGSDESPAWDGTNEQQPEIDKVAGGVINLIDRLRTSEPGEFGGIAIDEAKGVIERNKKVQAALRGQRAAEKVESLTSGQAQVLRKKLTKESVDVEQDAGDVDAQLAQKNEDIDAAAVKVQQTEQRMQQMGGPLGSAAPSPEPTPVGVTPPLPQENLKPKGDIVRNATLGSAVATQTAGIQEKPQA